MKKARYLIIACFFVIPVKAQTIDYIADADKLYAVLQKTPSYRAQIKGDKEVQYKQVFEQVKKDLINAKTGFDRYYILSQLLAPLKDNHLFFYQVPAMEISSQMFKDTTFIKTYRASAAFKEYPRSGIKLDSLEKLLKGKAIDDVEGIYYLDRDMKVGLYRTAKQDSLVAVVLENFIPTWDVGQIAFILKEDRPNHFKAYHSHLLNKVFGLQSNEKFLHGMLTESGWKKALDGKDFVNISRSEPAFSLKTIDANIQYLRLGTFSTYPKTMEMAQAFYDKIKDSLSAPNLIVDLRNNGGGGFKTSKKFLDLLKKYTDKGKVYALINNRTFSNAEQFTLALKGLKNITTLGETTNGTLTYGNNYGNTETLPSGQFKLYITDMREDGNYLPYEGIGVNPDVLLKPDRDWITQVREMIVNGSN
jgi:hypothetical protein